jgi:hypothetical protein
MTLYRKQTLDDGATIVADNVTNEEWALKAGQWEEITLLPYGEQRAKLDEFLAANEADPTGGRTEIDEQTMQTAHDAQTGEAHQESERRE